MIDLHHIMICIIYVHARIVFEVRYYRLHNGYSTIESHNQMLINN